MIRRFVAAPFDARLASSDVVAGQQVNQGQRLATLDGSELKSELAGLRAELAQSEQRLLAALSAGDHSKAEFERLETEQLTQEISLLENRWRQLEIRTPIDGIVISGDLECAQGKPLSSGDNLYEIASLDRFIAEIAVSESDVNHVQESMQVSLSLEAEPGEDRQTSIVKIHLRNEIRENQSVFIAEAELGNATGMLRPGMNGIATVHAGYRALGWVLFHRPYNAVRHWIGW